MKLYPCQKIALAEMDESSDRTNAGVWTYKLRCRLIDKRVVLWRLDEDFEVELQNNWKAVHEEPLIKRLCAKCEWREDLWQD